MKDIVIIDLIELGGVIVHLPVISVNCLFKNVFFSGIGSPGKFESLTDIIHNKIEETDGRFLIGQEEDTEPPYWAALFEGSRPMVVQKTVLSPGKESNQSNTSPVTASRIKRRAPPPPPDKLPFVQPTSVLPSQEKENCRGARPRTGRPSLDAKFSAIIQQLQKSHTSTRKNAPLGQIEPCQHPCIPQKRDDESDIPENPGKEDSQAPQPPVPAPRNKLRMSFREKMNPKAWWINETSLWLMICYGKMKWPWIDHDSCPFIDHIKRMWTRMLGVNVWMAFLVCSSLNKHPDSDKMCYF